MRLFSNDLEGTFVSRPNRYLVTVDTPTGAVEAHLPNPGRLGEILFPGTPIILERATQRITTRKTAWTAVAAIHNQSIVPLVASRANEIARYLILPRLFGDAREVAAEQQLGSSRVDFVVQQPDRRTYVEVKSCTLVEHGVAMFPDAPSERATRHLGELHEVTRNSTDGALVLIVITHGSPRVFVPNVHTDPAFSRTSREVTAGSTPVAIHAVAVQVNAHGVVDETVTDVEVDLAPVDLVDADGGAYLLVVRIERPTRLRFGANGVAGLNAGFYVYAGSAVRGLSARLARHRRRRKHHHWHIDDLLAAGTLVADYPILTARRIEHELAADVTAVADDLVPGFGASDSPLPSHLFYFASDPRARSAFAAVLFRHRHLDIFPDR